MKSDAVKTGMQQAPHRSLFNALGMTQEEMKKPLVGIVSSYNEIVPGHMNLDKIVEAVKLGVAMAGGTPVVFPAIAVCDGIAMGHIGMKYSLVTRDLIADSTECMAIAHQFDALVMVPNCDKNVPGLLMAAARINVPTVFVSGGPMLAGHVKGHKTSLSSMFEAVGSYAAGTMSLEDVEEFEAKACPTCGSCSGMYTANSMNCLTEVLGMGLKGNGTIPAVYSERIKLAKHAGMQVMEMYRRNIRPRDIMTKEAFINALTMDMALGCSTNSMLHLPAIAHEAELDIKVLDEFDSLSRTTPQIAKMNPACKYSIVDFYKDGGVPRLMENLRSMLETDVMTVTAHTLAENIDSHKYLYPATGLVNHTLDDPFGYTGGVAVLRGNLAPDTGITKPGAFDKSLHHFKGEAICFDSEEAAEEAILAGKIHDGHVVVIRYEGPKGGPGMREMFKAMKYLYGRGLAKTTALITDGRFSGTNNGCFVGHISPEAAEGGPIAIVHDGDTIEIDVDNKQLNLLVPDEEIEARLKQWKRPEPKFKKGWLGLYCKLAASGSEGGVMKFDHL